MKIDVQTALKILVSVVAIAIVVIILRGVDLTQTLSILLQANPVVLLLVLCVQAASVTVRLFRWQSLLRPASHVPLRALVAPLMIGYAVGNVTVTGVGALPRIYLLNRRSGIDSGFITGTWLQENLLDAAALLFWVAVIPFLVSLPPGFRQIQVVAAALVTVLAIVELALSRRPTSLVGPRPHSGFWGQVLKRVPDWITTKIGTFMGGVSDSLGEPRLCGAVVLSTALIWAIESMVFWLILLSLDMPFNYIQASAITAFTYLVAGVPAVPGYIGTLELSTVGLVLALGGQQATALAYVVLLRLFFVGPYTVAGAVLAWREGWRPGRWKGTESQQ